MHHRNLIRRLGAVVGATALGVGLAAAGVLSGASTAHAATASTTAAASYNQVSAYCQATTAGRACVALDYNTTADNYRAVFSVTPAKGQYMKPVSWTTINPGFKGTDHAFGAAATNKAWTRFGGNMSVSSVIGFTYNTAGHTYRIYAGTGALLYTASKAPASLIMDASYAAENNKVTAYLLVRLAIHGNEPAYSPQYLRVFTRYNTTLYGAKLCPTGGCQPISEYGNNVRLAFPYHSIGTPLGAAATVTFKGTPVTLVTRTAA